MGQGGFIENKSCTVRFAHVWFTANCVTSPPSGCFHHPPKTVTPFRRQPHSCPAPFLPSPSPVLAAAHLLSIFGLIYSGHFSSLVSFPSSSHLLGPSCLALEPDVVFSFAQHNALEVHGHSMPQSTAPFLWLNSIPRLSLVSLSPVDGRGVVSASAPLSPRSFSHEVEVLQPRGVRGGEGAHVVWPLSSLLPPPLPFLLLLRLGAPRLGL